MKKSFMTRALATGLSLAMAFSLSAATNVTVASAASTPTMASKQFAVRVGGATKTYKASAATLKTYRITKATVGNSSKATVAVASSKKGIKVTPGTVTGSTVVKVTFKNSKTKKSTAKKFRCVVKAPVDESYKITSATATGVKTITVELNKAVANAPSLSAIVKKGASTRDSKFTVDGSKIVIAMDTKLMAGTYTVTIEGLEATALTADVAVEKDETLTKYEISPNLTMATDTATDSAICYYSAVNQYGEPMVADKPDASSSFSTKTEITRTATATAKGVITITEIPTVLAIKGTKGTIVLVDKNNGINTSQEVTVSDAATAAEVTVAGTYNNISSSIETISAGVELSNYYILLSVKDQYGDPVDKDKFAPVANISLAGGLTGVELAGTGSNAVADSLTTVVVDGTEYIAIKLKAGKAVAGTYTMTIVNTKRGLLSSATYDVIDSVIASSITITPKNGVYLGDDNEMEYSVIDKDGKEVTSFAVLNEIVKFGDNSGMAWKKNKDGSAKLIYKPNDDVKVSGNSDTASTIATIVAYANAPSSSNYIVKTFTFTVNRERKVKSVQGLASGTTLSVAKGKELSIPLDKIIYADQYSNKVTKDDKIYKTVSVTSAAIATGDSVRASGCAVAFDRVGNVFDTAVVSGTALVFKSPTAGAINVYLKFIDNTGKNVKDQIDYATKQNADYKFTVTATDTGSVAAASLKIDNINNGYAVNVSPAGTKLTKEDIKVVGVIGGSLTEIPKDQITILKDDNNSFTTAEISAGTKTKKATVTVRVTTWDTSNNPIVTDLTADYQVSVEASKVFKVTDLSAVPKEVTATAASGSVVSAGALHQFFKFKDQYGNDKTTGIDGVAYELNITSAVNGNTKLDIPRVYNNGSKDAYVTLPASAGVYTIEVTATVGSGDTQTTKTTTIKYTLS